MGYRYDRIGTCTDSCAAETLGSSLATRANLNSALGLWADIDWGGASAWGLEGARRVRLALKDKTRWRILYFQSLRRELGEGEEAIRRRAAPSDIGGVESERRIGEIDWPEIILSIGRVRHSLR
jgi:hypothetical protein